MSWMIAEKILNEIRSWKMIVTLYPFQGMKFQLMIMIARYYHKSDWIFWGWTMIELPIFVPQKSNTTHFEGLGVTKISTSWFLVDAASSAMSVPTFTSSMRIQTCQPHLHVLCVEKKSKKLSNSEEDKRILLTNLAENTFYTILPISKNNYLHLENGSDLLPFYSYDFWNLKNGSTLLPSSRLELGWFCHYLSHQFCYFLGPSST